LTNLAESWAASLFGGIGAFAFCTHKRPVKIKSNGPTMVDWTLSFYFKFGIKTPRASIKK